MTKTEAIEYMTKRGYKPDDECKVLFKIIDHSNNPIAPEKFCYKLSYICLGSRVKFAIWPNTIGFQGCK